MRNGALFAGYGGLDLAVESVFGARPAWVSEFDAAPSRILAHRFPGVPNLGDVKALGNGVVPQQAEAALRHLLAVRAMHAPGAVAA